MTDEKKDAMEAEAEEEEQRERPEKKGPPRPSVPGVDPAYFNRGARVWLYATSFFLAVTAYYAAPADFFLRSRALFAVGSVVVTPMLFVAAAVFALAAWFGLKRFGPLLVYHKPGQGRWVRLTGYLGLAALAFFAGFSLHKRLFLALPTGSGWIDNLWSVRILGWEFVLRPIFFAGGALFTLLVVGYHLFMNRAKWVDFLIETQSELLKVSWPPRREWWGSTVVVFVVMSFISLFLFGVDEVLSYVLEQLGIGF